MVVAVQQTRCAQKIQEYHEYASEKQQAQRHSIRMYALWTVVFFSLCDAHIKRLAMRMCVHVVRAGIWELRPRGLVLCMRTTHGAPLLARGSKLASGATPLQQCGLSASADML